MAAVMGSVISGPGPCHKSSCPGRGEGATEQHSEVVCSA
jgi:hypothetical protein